MTDCEPGRRWPPGPASSGSTPIRTRSAPRHRPCPAPHVDGAAVPTIGPAPGPRWCRRCPRQPHQRRPTRLVRWRNTTHRLYPSLDHSVITSPTGTPAHTGGGGNQSRNRVHHSTTRSTRDCWSIPSATRIDQRSRTRLHGRSRRRSRPHESSPSGRPSGNRRREVGPVHGHDGSHAVGTGDPDTAR